MLIREERADTVEVFDNDIVGFCHRLSELAVEAITSFEAIIYPRDGGDIDYIDLIFLCSPSDRCSITAFAVRADGSGVGANAAEIPSLIGAVLAASALSGSYAEIIKGDKDELARRAAELSSKLNGTTRGVSDEEVDIEKFMARIASSAKVIGTGTCPSRSKSALNLFLRSLMAATCLAHSRRISSVLADEIRGGPAGHTLPAMILTSRVSTSDTVVTVFLELSNDEAGVAAEVRERGEVSVLEGFEAVRSFIGILKKRKAGFVSYCTVLYGYAGMGQY